MSTTKRHRSRGDRATTGEIAAAYNLTPGKVARWRLNGALITRTPDGDLAEWSPGYPDAPAAIRRTGRRSAER